MAFISFAKCENGFPNMELITAVYFKSIFSILKPWGGLIYISDDTIFFSLSHSILE